MITVNDRISHAYDWQEHTLRAFENWVLRRIFGLKRYEIK
jgi:hypothetical protein